MSCISYIILLNVLHVVIRMITTSQPSTNDIWSTVLLVEQLAYVTVYVFVTDVALVCFPFGYNKASSSS